MSGIQGKAGAGTSRTAGVREPSSRMLLAIGAILLAIILPSFVYSMPLSKIEVTVTNTSQLYDAQVRVFLTGRYGDSEQVPLGANETRVFTFAVRAGEYEVRANSIRQVYDNYTDYTDYQYKTVDVSLFETERVSIYIFY